PAASVSVAPVPFGPALARVPSATTGPFGGMHTAVSPGAAPAGAAGDAGPDVRIVTAAPRGFSLAALLAVALAAWLMGLLAGYVLGSR
ncbi:MAG TPA: hypothetical protein PLU22_24025, partial [Polyangiaceae bacterium]|nr:hypothetical protein [Polyangiaceae bacterium]